MGFLISLLFEIIKTKELKKNNANDKIISPSKPVLSITVRNMLIVSSHSIKISFASLVTQMIIT